ncbi:MAG: hypothetical protein V4613_07705 [Bacteroidota bacterium]
MNTSSFLPNFDITANAPIANAFTERGLNTFIQAADYIMHLPYGRNTDKSQLLTVFSDNCGTCGTKHAILKQLADEHHRDDIELILGMVKMNAVNTPDVATTLKKHQLDYIPEAHNYLKYNGRIIDITKPVFTVTHDADNILREISITPEQITDYKVSYHKQFLSEWMINNGINLSLDQLWAIREQCIQDLSTASTQA